MRSRDGNDQVTKDDIENSQSLLGSYGNILKRCLKTYPAEAVNCDEAYKAFARRQQMLKSQEEQYLAPLGQSLNRKREKFDKAFDPMLANPDTTVELSKESKALKKEICDGTTEILKAKREFESFRNKELKQTVHRAPYCFGFNIDWSRKFPNKEINTMLNKDLQDSDEALKSIDKRMSDNESAPYVTTLEMFNDQLKAFKK